jgi:DNA-binding NtrC family response regulator
VDDERSVLSTTRRMLEADHDVVTIEHARDALSLIAAGENFDLVLSDVVMPHVSGKGLYEAALALNPGLASRFVFVTGGTTAPDLVTFLASVSDERLAKPYRIEQLLDVARRRLETHHREAPQL